MLFESEATHLDVVGERRIHDNVFLLPYTSIHDNIMFLLHNWMQFDMHMIGDVGNDISVIYIIYKVTIFGRYISPKYRLS